MARPKKFLKTLSEEELKKLKEISNSRTEEVRKVQRAKIILLASQGTQMTVLLMKLVYQFQRYARY